MNDFIDGVVTTLIVCLILVAITGLIVSGVYKNAPAAPGAILCSLDGRIAEVVPSDSFDYRGNGDWYISHGKEQSVFHQAVIESCIWIPNWKAPVATAAPKQGGEEMDHHLKTYDL